MTSLDIGAAQSEDEARQFAAVLHESLRFPSLDDTDWLPRYDLADMRVVRAGGRVVAGALLLSMGQWFGGRRVPMIGVHAVGVLPEYRGRGIGRTLMRAMVEEIHARGVPLSVLYPATQPVYRQAGFEQAGSWNRYRVDTESLIMREREVDIDRIGPLAQDEQLDAIVDELGPVYTEQARHELGNLDRSRWAWQRALMPLSRPAYTFCARRDGRIEGYLTFMHSPHAQSNLYDLDCRDLVALTPAALRGLLGFLGNHRSMARHTYIVAPPVATLSLMLREQGLAQGLQEDMSLRWMTRIIDVERALEARGYPPGMQTSVRFSVRDEVLGHNRRAFVLHVADGRGAVAAVADAAATDVTLDIRGLAALYTGYASGLRLRALGLAEGDSDNLARLSALFAGPAPWMLEVF